MTESQPRGVGAAETDRAPGDAPRSQDGGFDEHRYLAAFPDIAEDVRRGVWESGQAHYIAYGSREGRLIDPAYLRAAPSNDSVEFPLCHIDTALISPSGWCLITGWINDENAPLRALGWSKSGTIVAATDSFARCRREDAEPAAQASEGTLLGFWTIFHSKEALSAAKDLRLHVWVQNNEKIFEVGPRLIADRQMRDHALEYLARTRYFANYQAEAIRQLKSGVGKAVVQHNIEISSAITHSAYVMRFGDHDRHLDGSIIVCLFGKPEYLFLQAAAFSACPGMERYELIYVSNSPELAERLSQEATMASRIYGIGITLVVLSGNAGFGGANNVAAKHARSDRLLFVNPDVFPRDSDWPTRHSAVTANLPAAQTKIFGVPLYYDNGSLMHAGMYFDFDTGLSIHDGRIERVDMIRVEHYAKGAPPETQAFLASRPVPAVTGAFLSIDRAWFEALGGFSLEYVFGHYEDADFCLRSLQQGQPPWLHCVKFWHLEGNGSVRYPAQEGGSIVNRWHFTASWRDFILDGLVGPTPARLPSAPPERVASAATSTPAFSRRALAGE